MTLVVSCIIGWPAIRDTAHAQQPPQPKPPIPAPGVPTDQAITGVDSPARVNADTEVLAKKQQAPQLRGRNLYFVWSSISPAEFEALGRQTLFLIGILTQKAEELPVKRVYLRVDGKEQPVYKVSGWRTPVDGGSVTAKVFGPNRDDGFYLVPGGAMLRKGQLVLDLSANFSGWVQMNFPANVAESDPKHFPNLDPVPNAKPDLKTLQAIIQRKFTGFPVPQSLP
jgi:hypothetical protein